MTEIIDKLYLELSLISNAFTARERWQAEVIACYRDAWEKETAIDYCDGACSKPCKFKYDPIKCKSGELGRHMFKRKKELKLPESILGK